MTGASHGAPQLHFAWQVQHMEHLSFILHGRVPRQGAAREASSERSGEGQRRLITMGAGCFCVAGAALGAHQLHFAWQGQHLEHLQIDPGKAVTIDYYGRGLHLRACAAHGAPQLHFAWQVQHLEHLQRRPRKAGDD